MCQELGANFTTSQFRTTFESLKGNTIHILFDICHMLKLIRNNLCQQQILYSGDEKIMWRHYIDLNNLQLQEGLHVGNKLTTRHIKFGNEKMRVFLAAQLFSTSVADALEFLSKKQTHSLIFKDSNGTIHFTRTINNLFDIFNSKNCFGKGYKSCINKSNYENIFKYLDECKEYIIGLSYVGKYGIKEKVLNSNFKTGFLGFLVAIESFKSIFQTHVLDENIISYITAYKFSQDHLETFFGCIRSMGGYSNNPTAKQFYFAYRKMIMNKKVKATNNGNCIEDDNNIEMGETFNDLDETVGGDELCEDNLDNTDDFSNYFENNVDLVPLSEYAKDVVSYISGFVQKTVLKKSSCAFCTRILYSDTVSRSNLVDTKEYDWGNLIRPNKDLFEICKITERYFKTEIKIKNIMNVKEFALKIIPNIPKNIFDSLFDHTLQQDVFENHRYMLIKSIVQRYLDTRVNHYHKIQNIETKKSIVRTKLTNLVKFKNQ